MRQIRGTALFDSRRRYRYVLSREWDAALGRAAFIMLNPNRADELHDDPSIRRCMGFARDWGYGAVDVVNLFAARERHPARLRKLRRPVGPANDQHVVRVCARSSLIVAAWGIHGELLGRGREVAELLASHALQVHCLGLTQAGHPRHPLYLPRSLRPVPFIQPLEIPAKMNKGGGTAP